MAGHATRAASLRAPLPSRVRAAGAASNAASRAASAAASRGGTSAMLSPSRRYGDATAVAVLTTGRPWASPAMRLPRRSEAPSSNGATNTSAAPRIRETSAAGRPPGPITGRCPGDVGADGDLRHPPRQPGQPAPHHPAHLLVGGDDVAGAGEQPERRRPRAERRVDQGVERHDGRRGKRRAQRAAPVAIEVGRVLQVHDVGGGHAPPGRRLVEDREHAHAATRGAAPRRGGDDRHLLALARQLLGETARVVTDPARHLLRRGRRAGDPDAHGAPPPPRPGRAPEAPTETSKTVTETRAAA